MRNECLSKRWFVLGFLVIAAALMLGAIAFTPAQANAITVKNGAKVYALSQNVTYSSYDFTGDRKPDTFRIYATKDSYHTGNHFSVYINGKCAFSKTARYYEIIAKLIQLKNGKCFIYLFDPADNADADVCALFKVKSGKLVKVIDFNKGFPRNYGNHAGGEVTKVNGNSLTAEFRLMATMSGQTYADYTYKYKSGKLRKVSNYGKLKVGYQSTNTFQAEKRITAYRNVNCKSVKFKIKKNQNVTFRKIYIRGSVVRYQVKAGGKTGWIKVARSYDSPLLYKQTNAYGFTSTKPPFKGIYWAG